MIFIERDEPLSEREINEKLSALENACVSSNDELVRATLKKVVPTYRSSEEVNAEALNSDEMKNCKEAVLV